MLDLLIDTCTRLFADAPDEELQNAVESGQWPEKLWSEVDDNGLPLLLVPEEAGGVGLGYRDVAAVLRLAGAFAVPLPLADTIIAQHLFALAGQQPFEGPAVLAPNAYDDRLRIDVGARAVSGSVRRIPWLRPGRRLVVVGETDSGRTGVGALRVGEVTELPMAPVREPLGSAKLEGAALELAAELPEAWSCARVRALGALCRAALIAGAMERILDLAISHAQGREQFGRPVGSFQAVQQNIAALAGQVASVRVAVELAAADFPGDPRYVGAAAAKARASEACRPVTAIAHQVHAAIGFTREHDLQLFTRRLWTWRDELGTEEEWHHYLGGLAVQAGPDGVWPMITGT
jgi:alkylation response protein AidB-like acyl-CoA dehydrogenase